MSKLKFEDLMKKTVAEIDTIISETVELKEVDFGGLNKEDKVNKIIGSLLDTDAEEETAEEETVEEETAEEETAEEETVEEETVEEETVEEETVEEETVEEETVEEEMVKIKNITTFSIGVSKDIILKPKEIREVPKSYLENRDVFSTMYEIIK